MVDLQTSALDGFCDGSKDFLKLSRLISRFHSVDHSKNAQECLDCVHATCGTFGGTYGNENSGPLINVPLDPRQLMLIWDTGASFGLTPLQNDFIDYVACTIPVRDITKANNVIGIGTTLHKFTDTQGFPVISSLCFLSLTTDGRPFILSPHLSPNAWWLSQGLWQLHQDAVEDLRDSNTDREGET
jgi:hypothetical protein